MNFTTDHVSCDPDLLAALRMARTEVKQSWPDATYYEAREPRRLDAALYLNALCKLCLDAGHDGQKIAYMVEDDGGATLPEPVCRMLGMIVCELLGSISVYAPQTANALPIRIVLRRRGRAVLCAIFSDVVRRAGPCVPASLPRRGKFADMLGKSCALRRMPERGLIAVLLDVEKAGRHVGATIAGYRAARTEYGRYRGGLDA
jgi:hypothetical protein